MRLRAGTLLTLMTLTGLPLGSDGWPIMPPIKTGLRMTACLINQLFGYPMLFLVYGPLRR
jgi:hypothetical protein